MSILKASALVFPIFLFCTWFGLFKIHHANEYVYIDEEFHVPQAQRFCRGNTEWDPKITTPPGLYFVSYAALKILGFSSNTFLCDIFLLRLVNSIFICLNFIILSWIYSKIHKNCGWTELMDVLGIALFPVLYLFSFLYYTDVMSTTSILMMYLCHLSGQSILAGVFGFLSLWMRQTNVIWVVFTAALFGHKLLTEALENEKLQIDKEDFLRQLLEGLKRPKIILKIVIKELPYLLVGLSFVLFLVWNEGIVLGDKSAHEATIHLPQLLYFSLVCAAFTPSLFLRFIVGFPKLLLKNKLLMHLTVVAIGAAVHLNTMAHPYLLADNRHYAFYLWRRLLQPILFRYALTPVYLICVTCIVATLRRRGTFFQLLFAFCVAASLVPQLLLEPRYFVVPFIMFRLHIPRQSFVDSAFNLLVTLAVNFFTIYVYIYCPFAGEKRVHFVW